MTLVQEVQNLAQRASGAVGRDSWLIRRLRPGYDSLLDLMTGGRGIPWDVNGCECRIDPRCRPLVPRIFDEAVSSFLREHVKPGQVCIDVGANVGAYVLQLATWVGTDGRVIAFEPNPAARAALMRNVELSGFGKRVTVEGHAVSSQVGSATLHADSLDARARLATPNRLLDGRTTTIDVPVTSLDVYCAERRLSPNWILIDIEGFEFRALEGARELLARSPELGLVVEMHPNVWESAGTSRAAAEALLDELHLEAIPLMGQSDPLDAHASVLLKRRP